MRAEQVTDPVAHHAEGPVWSARWGGLRALPRRFEPKSLEFGIADNAGTRPDLASAPWSVAWGDLDHL